MSRRRPLLLWLAAGATVLAVAAGGVALAQSTPTPTPSPGDKQAAVDDFLNRFAAKLGVPRENVIQAAKDAAKESIDAAVSAGRLPPERAAELKRRIDERPLAGIFPGVGPGRSGGPRGAVDKGALVQAAASALGVTPEELTSALRQGRLLDDLAREKGKDPAAVRAAIRDAARRALQPAVDAGRLSAQEADARADAIAREFGTRPLGDRKRGRPGPSPSPTPTPTPTS